ncbi:MAG: hypothetical protein ABEI27_13250 [Halobellus sp.]|uniref:DUF7261 family protein n=1 Tax=Halobellus sp. TaxID=1979212 RepID=UPI0035D4DA8C
MADLNGVRRGGAGTDRGQLLLVGALSLAVLFVALALLLNTAIYTGNLATREAGIGGTEAVEYVSASQDGGIAAIESVNRRNASSHATLYTALRETMAAWDDTAAHHRAVNGDAADVDVVGTTNGTRIRQRDANRNFSSVGGAPDWTVVDGAMGIRSIRFEVDAARLKTGPTNSFRMDVSSADGTRSLSLYNNSTDDPRALIDGPAGTATCPAGSAPGGTFVVDVANGSVGGASCPALTRLDDTSGTVTVEYADGDVAGGRYSIVVNGTSSSLSLPGLASPGTGDPDWTDAVYAASIRVSYRTPQMEYTTTVEVVPA